MPVAKGLPEGGGEWATHYCPGKGLLPIRVLLPDISLLLAFKPKKESEHEKGGRKLLFPTAFLYFSQMKEVTLR